MAAPLHKAAGLEDLVWPIRNGMAARQNGSRKIGNQPQLGSRKAAGPRQNAGTGLGAEALQRALDAIVAERERVKAGPRKQVASVSAGALLERRRRRAPLVTRLTRLATG
ncbi:MAG: hypothetical protein ACREDL_21930 [Bradyrhizobium sp.]